MKPTTMSETLREKQSRFARALPRLLNYAHSLGYEVTLGEAYRTDEQAEINALGFRGREALASLVENQFPLLAKKLRNNRGNGIRNSTHCVRLAVDIQLFDRSGAWVQSAHAYSRLADFWESLGPDHKAGVRWGDTFHYSIEHEGAK